MYITWLGHSCFKLQDKVGADGLTVVTDPYDKKIGLKMPNFEADIVTVSHDHYDHNNISALRNNPFVVKGAGEYDIKGVLITGLQSDHDRKQGAERGKNIIFRIEMEDITITHLGDLGVKLDNKQLEKLTGTDVLLIPVGGRYTLSIDDAVETIASLEPRLVIPMHYQFPGLAIELDGVEKFIKAVGLKPTYEERLKISKKELPQENTELVILKI